MKRTGFTLIELLIIMLIVGCLFGLVLPAIVAVRRADARLQTGSFLIQMTHAILNAENTWRTLPPATGSYGIDKSPNSTLHVHILPFISQQDSYELIRQRRSAAESLVIPPFLLPLDPTLDGGAGATNVAANLRVFSDLGIHTPKDEQITPDLHGNDPRSGRPWFHGSASLRDSIPDGASNTVALATQYLVCGAEEGRKLFSTSAGKKTNSPFFGFFASLQGASSDEGIENGRAGEIFQVAARVHDCNPSYTAQGYSETGILVTVLGGSVYRVSSRVSPATWSCLLQPNDGTPLPQDWDR